MDVQAAIAILGAVGTLLTALVTLVYRYKLEALRIQLAQQQAITAQATENARVQSQQAARQLESAKRALPAPAPPTRAEIEAIVDQAIAKRPVPPPPADSSGAWAAHLERKFDAKLADIRNDLEKQHEDDTRRSNSELEKLDAKVGEVRERAARIEGQIDWSITQTGRRAR